MNYAAHKLALHDLGKAIAINPIGGDNYYLRGDCHSKLGNYEQVCISFFNRCIVLMYFYYCIHLVPRCGCLYFISCFVLNYIFIYLIMKALHDYDMAEENRFEDKCALYIARGSVRRLLGHSELASNDFRQAYDLLDRQDKVNPRTNTVHNIP